METKILGKVIFDIIDRVPAIADIDNSIDSLTLKESIQFENITFKY